MISSLEGFLHYPISFNRKVIYLNGLSSTGYHDPSTSLKGYHKLT